MQAAGFRWVTSTVSEVERGDRALTIDEIGGLTKALECSAATLVPILARSLDEDPVCA